MMKKGTHLLTLLLTFSILPAWAKEKPKIEIRVEEKEEATYDTTAHTEVIRPSEVTGVATTIPKLLERVAGIHIKRYGGLDDFAAVSIRGSTTDQVLIYLDGVLLNTAQGGLLDLSFLPMNQIEKIEIYRGGSPGKIVDSTPGGVIYIHTKKKPDKTENKIRNHIGSFWTYRGDASRSQPIKDFYYHLSFDHFRSKGDFSFLDDRGTRGNPNDDRIVQRQNNDFQSYDWIASFGREKKESIRWKIYENFFWKESGIPGLGTRTSLNAELQTLRNFLNATLESPSNNTALQWKTDLFFDLLKSQFDDPQGEIGLGTQDNDDLTFRFGPQFRASYPLKNHIVSGFVAHRGEFFWPTNHIAADPEGPLSQRHMISIGAEDEISFFGDRLIVDPSVRFQIFINNLSGQDPSFNTTNPNNNITDKQFSAKLGLKYQPWSFLSFKANIYRGFRQPTFSELFGDRGTLVGNPTLSPEEAFNFDLGGALEWKQLGILDSAVVEANLFRQSINNLIQFIQNSQFTAQAQNLNDALIWGGEFALRLRLFKNLKASGNYVYQNAKDHGANSPTNGNFLPGRPQHQFFLEGDYQIYWARPFIEFQMTSHNFIDAQNLLRVDNRKLMAAGIHLSPHKTTKVSFQTKNLLNDRISDVAGFPLPGRSYWGELEFQL